MSELLIEIDGVGVELSGRRVVDGVSLTVAGGQILALVGPNGAGKTSLLRALAGFLPASGGLKVAGLDPRRETPARLARSRAYCAQKPGCAWDYRVADLGEIIGDPAGFRVWLTRLGLGEFGERRLRTLSGGEHKCAHLAMVFASLAEPFGGVLLLDEPEAALDLVRRESVRQAMVSFARAGAACVVATHDLAFARGCDAIIVLSEGRMVAAGPPAAALTAAVITEIWGGPTAD